MKTPGLKILIFTVLGIAAAATMIWLVHDRFQDRTAGDRDGKTLRPVPVEATAIGHGPIALKREFT